MHHRFLLCNLWKLLNSGQPETLNYSPKHIYPIFEMKGNVNVFWGLQSPRGGKVLLCAAGKQAWQQEAVQVNVCRIQYPSAFLCLLIEVPLRQADS